MIRQGAAIFSDMNDLFNGIEPDCEQVKSAAPERKTAVITDEMKSKSQVKDEISLPPEITGKVEVRISEEIKSGLIDVDEFIRRNSFSADEVNRGITVLEISGFIERKGNRLYKT
jgi:predicted Rossmann fold nucleotide-binding protein DprA/Smf involved in DNA uptake